MIGTGMSAVDDSTSRKDDRSSGYDPLSDVLSSVRLTGALFFLWEVSAGFVSTAPAGRQLASALLPDAQQILSFHVVDEGECWGGLLGSPPIRLTAGDVLLIPEGHP